MMSIISCLSSIAQLLQEKNTSRQQKSYGNAGGGGRGGPSCPLNSTKPRQHREVNHLHFVIVTRSQIDHDMFVALSNSQSAKGVADVEFSRQ